MAIMTAMTDSMCDDGALIPVGEVDQTAETQEARELRWQLEQAYSDDLPRLVSMWIMSYKSVNTRLAYRQRFPAWEAFCRSVGVHPLAALRPHADAYARSLDAQGIPNTTSALMMSVASSFYRYAMSVDATDRNPFAMARRPYVDPDYSPTEGLTQSQSALLIEEARRDSPRSYALVVLLYTLGLRIGGALGADVSDLGYDRGHRTLTVKIKGDGTAKKALPPLAVHALEMYLDGRTSGPLFATRNGTRLDRHDAWVLLRRLAKQADLPQKNSIHPHVLRHNCITDALNDGVALHEVQDFVDHKDPRTTRRYDRARGALDRSPSYTVAANIARKLGHRDD